MIEILHIEATSVDFYTSYSHKETCFLVNSWTNLN